MYVRHGDKKIKYLRMFLYKDIMIKISIDIFILLLYFEFSSKHSLCYFFIDLYH